MENESENKQHPEKNQDLTQNKLFWIIGAALLLVVGFFSWKMIFGGDEDFKVTLIDFPKEANAGFNTTFTWRIDGPAEVIPQTSVYYGTVSNPGELGKDVKPADTKYEDFVKDFANGKYNIPLQFVGNTIISPPGKYYFRVYALIREKNYWSDEYSFEVKSGGDYKVTMVNTTKDIRAGQVATFTWRIDGAPNMINYTSVYFGEESTPGVLDKKVKPESTKYTESVKDFTNGKYNIPLQFVGNVKIATAGSYFYRGYAVINGENYWTDEGTFAVK